jgi:hypothetical protein
MQYCTSMLGPNRDVRLSVAIRGINAIYRGKQAGAGVSLNKHRTFLFGRYIPCDL